MRKALFVALVLAGVLTAAIAAPRGQHRDESRLR